MQHDPAEFILEYRGSIYTGLAELDGMETFALLNLLYLIQTLVYHKSEIVALHFSNQQ